MKIFFTSLFIALSAMTLSAQDCREGRCFGTHGNNADNGNNLLGQSYNQTLCGLNFVASSQMLTQRYSGTPTGVGLPAALNMQMPNCVGVNGVNVDKAYIWWGVSYNFGSSTTPTLTVTNPANQTNSFVASLVGTSGPKCWGETGTRTFRADVTSAINGNGNYTINIAGNPVSEIDGATFIIIYRDPAASYTGTLIINDGCETYMGAPPTTANTTLTNFTACANSVNGRGFSVTGDQQNNIFPPSHQTIVNGVTQTFSNVFWNYDEINANVTSGQTSVVISNTPNPSDCWSWNVVGYYYQTNCTTCTQGGSLTASVASANALCGQNNGSAWVTVSGGSVPYTYAWNTTPVQSSATATGLGAGSYTCSIVDQCGNAAVEMVDVLATPGDSVSVSSSGGSCNSGVLTSPYGGQPIVLTANVTNGTPPYNYLWSDGSTTSSISVTTGGVYSVVVTDANGCTTPNTPGSTVNVSSVNVNCGHNGDKIILCHVPPGNPGNPQTICVAASAIPSHLANHPGDCVGPCSLYYAPRYSQVMDEINQVGFFAEAYPNPTSNGFALHMIVAPDEPVTVNIHDMTGRVIETYINVTEQTQIGTKLSAGIYAADVIQGDNHQMLHIVKVN